MALSSDDNILFVGAPWDNTGGTGKGAVYIFAKNNDNWSYSEKIHHGFDGLALGNYDRFGSALALSQNRNTLFVYGNDGQSTTGFVYIFTGQGTAWKYVGKLSDSEVTAEGIPESKKSFGRSLVTTSDGNTVYISYDFTLGGYTDAIRILKPNIPLSFLGFVKNQQYFKDSNVTAQLPEAIRGTGDIAYSVTALPSGLSFDSESRQITGTPTAISTTSVTYTATDSGSPAQIETSVFSIAIIQAVPPSAPTGLTAVADNNRVTLSWTAPTGEPITGYEYSSDNGSTWSEIADSDDTTTEYIATDLDFRRHTILSKSEQLIPGEKVRHQIRDRQSPCFGLSSIYVGYNKIQLTWTAPSDTTDISGYQYKQDNGSWTDITGSTVSTTSHIISSLTPGTAYAFRLRAVDSNSNVVVESEEMTVAPNEIGDGTSGLFVERDRFGSSVAISSDSSTLFVGAKYDDTGGGKQRRRIYFYQKC